MLVASLVAILFFAPISETWMIRILFILLGVLLHGIITSKHIRRLLLTLFGILLLILILIQTEPVQNFIIGKITTGLSKELKTEVSIQHVSFSFFDRLDLNGTLIRDHEKDTLLYAGALKIRLTDWFFMRNKIDLTYIGLEDAIIKQQRKDSVWNFQFLIDYFSGPPSKDTSKGIALNLDKLDLKNVTYIKNDEWVGQKMIVKTGSLLLDAEKIDLNNGILFINTLDLDKPYLSIENFDGKRPETSDYGSSEKDTGLIFNPGDMLVKVKIIKISNGYFGNFKRGDISESGKFDGANIRANKLNGTIENFSFIKDTIRAKINLAADDRSGFQLKKLNADFKFTPHTMEFAKLDLRTNKSRISDYYAMHYKNFNEDMGHFIENVTIDSHMKNAEISSDDIAFFAPALSSWKRQFILNGKANGRVNDFKVTDFFLRADNNTYASGELSVKGLPQNDKTFITLNNARVQTNNNEIAFLYPPVKTINDPNLTALGNIIFQGNLTGTLQSFTAKGNMSSNLGGMYTNLTMRFPKKAEPLYNGDIETQQFDLGKFINVPSLGRVSFKGAIDGTSFSLEKIKTTLDGDFSSLEFNGYAYTDLHFNGTIEKKKFNGDFKAGDPNFDFTSNIEVDLSGAKPKVNVLGDLATANLKKLNLTKDNFQLTGLFDLNFEGGNIDEFLGSAKILNASLLHDTTKLSFDSLSLNSVLHDNTKDLSIESNEFNILVSGKFNILDLPNSFQLFLSRYYPSYINPPSKNPTDQNFRVTINTRNIDKYASLLDPKLSGLSNMQLVGGVNTYDTSFFAEADIPFAQYDKYKFENLDLDGKGNLDNLELKGTLGNVFIGDSTFFPETKFNIQSSSDHSVVHISTKANAVLNDADLNADVYTMEDGVRINFRPSSFILNDKKWNLEKQGNILIKQNFASAENVKFTQGFQEISIETEENDAGNQSNLIVKLKDLNLGDVLPFFMTRPKLEGLANGNIYLRDFYGSFHADADIRAEQFRMDDDSVGIVNIKADYTNATGKANYQILSENDKYNFSAEGFYLTKDSTGSPLHNTFHFHGTKINLLNEFLDGIFSNVTGYATGDLTWLGDFNSPQLLGKVLLKDAGLTVKYTQVRYTVDSAIFNFKENGIDFGQFTLHDMYKNSGIARGVLYERGFKNMSYDFDLSTNKLLLLDTKPKDNQQFYGRAIGKATLSLKGPQEDMRMNIIGEANDTTHIYIPTSNNKESADADFIIFKEYGTEIKPVEIGDKTKLSIDMDLTATNKAQIDVILDELTGDIIKATGNGRLRIRVPASGNITMNGRYNIEQGKYDFNFQSLVKRPFLLLPDANNYIEWNGNPYDATINIDAQYTAKNVSLGDLVNNTGLNLGGAVQGYKNDVYVIAQLRNKLTRPDISFKLDFLQGSAIKNDPAFNIFLGKLQSDDNEMLKQVTWLIVFGSFSPYGELAGTGSFERTGINTISQKISEQVNKMVSNLLSKITGDKSLQFDVNTSTYSSSQLYGSGNTNSLDRQQVNLKLSQSLLNGKVIIVFGGGFDFNIGSASAVSSGNFQWLPDISVQIILSQNFAKGSKIKAIVFNKSSLDVSTGIIGRRNRQGVSLTYTRDFENFRDLFGGGKQKKDTTTQGSNDIIYKQP